MKKFFVAVLLLVSFTSFAQMPWGMRGPQVIKLWPDGYPEKEYEAKPSDFQKRMLPEDFMEAKLTVYKAAKPNGICILECPGGGYTMLSNTHEGKDMSGWLNALGITYCVLDYRMPFGYSYVPLHDTERAMEIIREHSEEWGIEHIGVMGCSAGGHLASTLATHYSSENTRPDFQILLYPVITMDETFTHIGSRDNLISNKPAQEMVDEFSNEKHVDSNTPPALLILSTNDPTVDPKNSIEYFYALKKAGVSVSMHIYPEGGHGYGIGDSFTYKRQWTGEVEKWLDQLF